MSEVYALLHLPDGEQKLPLQGVDYGAFVRFFAELANRVATNYPGVDFSKVLTDAAQEAVSGA